MVKCAGVALIRNLYPIFRGQLLPGVRLSQITPSRRRRGWGGLLMLKRIVARVVRILLLCLCVLLPPDLEVASWSLGRIDVYIPEVLRGSVVIITEDLTADYNRESC